MSRVLLQKTDLHGLAARGAIVEEVLEAAYLSRLAPLVTDTAATVACNLALSLDSRGNTLVGGTVTTTVGLTCQRCLEPMAYRVEASLDVAIATGDESLAMLEAEHETVLPAEAPRLADLVEDEVLLALPLVAMHASVDDCGPLAQRLDDAAQDTSDERTTNNPFAVLKSLRSD